MDWDGATLWAILGALGLTGAASAWVGGYVGGFLTPPPRLVRAASHVVARAWRGQPPLVADGRYHLVLCGLDGDDAKEGTLRLLRGALNPQDYPMLHVTVSARCIRLRSWHARADDPVVTTRFIS